MIVTRIVANRSPSTHRVSRRAVLGGSVAMAAASTIPGGAFAAGSDSIRIGLVGCGGRGVGAALQAIAANPGVMIAAAGDLFADQLDAAKQTLSATCGNRFAAGDLFVGARAADLVIASDVDAVILATPPCCRPAEIAAAVQAGRHIYAEAPVGVDAAGVRLAAAAADDGIRRGLSLASGLQSRYHGPLRSTVAAVASGRIGRPLRAVATHRVGLPWVRPHQPGWSAADAAVRNWIGVDRLSGGGFLQHLVHAIDRCSWALGEPTPLSATAIPAAIALPQPLRRGIEATVRIAFVDGTSLEAGIVRREGIEDLVAEAIQGSRGSADLRHCTVATEAALASPTGDASGHATCMASFIESLRNAPPRTDLAAACRSTMLAVMARSAATGEGTVAWHDLWRPSPTSPPSRPVQSSMV
jgi:predicted dehydrogenase